MYSAETAESRNYPSPKEGRFGQQPVGRSQICVKSNEYYSPTVSSIKKKRNILEQQWPNRSRRPTAVHSSPKWAF
ncbi:hypothetical protein CTI12_AA449020 [Artemisia annua]|uniref:Uncharacterized protein n=1 Tax=Artemisia annua TaxID=35608 RepID=A0A2U1LVP1_ARTAN|nr:hypothetical protein CTI12_AA449020 [Artemisia annua]